MEEELATGLAERQVAEFVDDDQIETEQPFNQIAAATGGFLLFQLVDQIDEIIEPAARPGPDDGGRHGDAEMRLAGAGRSRDILPGITTPTGEFSILFIRDSVNR